MSLNLNMNDPSVRNLLGTDKSVQQPGVQARSMVHVAGDAPDPTGVTNHRGIQSTTRLDGAKQEVLVVYRDHVLTVDVYQLEGQPLELIMVCPRCQNQLRITADNKKIDYQPRSTRPVRLPDGMLVSYDKPLRTRDHVFTNAGTLSVEPFGCTWEMKGADKHTPGIRAGGLTLCNIKLVIDENVAREA